MVVIELASIEFLKENPNYPLDLEILKLNKEKILFSAT